MPALPQNSPCESTVPFYSSSSLSQSANLTELVPWSIEPPPRQDARFFFCISFRKPFPFTFSKSSDAWSAHESPADLPNFCFAKWVLSKSLESLIDAIIFSSSMRLKGTPDFLSFFSFSFLLLFLGASSASSAGAAAGASEAGSSTAAAAWTSLPFRFFRGWGAATAVSSATSSPPWATSSAGSVCSTCFLFFCFGVSCWPSGVWVTVAGAPLVPRPSYQSWQAVTRSNASRTLAFLDFFTGTGSSSSPVAVSLSNALSVLCRPPSTRKRRRTG
mmetsp:Transcript_81396/g.174234  ORF Transcript_81396/g.174234 Transcript_81396/m.174234 type:complete len:274 (-) Transcript_81396:108-929(-)